MTRIVDEHFAVADLPERLRLALGNATHVKLTIEDGATDEALRREFMDEVAKGMKQLDDGKGIPIDQVREGLKARFGKRSAAAE